MEELRIKLVHWAVAVPAAWMMAALPSCEAVTEIILEEVTELPQNAAVVQLSAIG